MLHIETWECLCGHLMQTRPALLRDPCDQCGRLRDPDAPTRVLELAVSCPGDMSDHDAALIAGVVVELLESQRYRSGLLRHP